MLPTHLKWPLAQTEKILNFDKEKYPTNIYVIFNLKKYYFPMVESVASIAHKIYLKINSIHLKTNLKAHAHRNINLNFPRRSQNKN